MRAMRLLLVGSLIAVIAGHSPGAWACSCAGLTEKESIAAAAVVFDGTPTSSRDLPPKDHDGIALGSTEYEFAVSKAIKGSAENGIRVSAIKDDGGNCGFTFRAGVEYRVFASKSDEGLSTHSCAGTRAIRGEAVDLPLGPEPIAVPAGGSGDGRGLTETVALAAAAAAALALIGGGAIWLAYRRADNG